MVVPYNLLGAAPSGTVTFYANGAPLSGTVTYASGGGSPPTFGASSTYTFSAVGNYAITASYSGDTNYSSSSASAQNITVLYPVPNVVVTPYSQNVNYGGTASITVLIDTINKSVYPTGTVTFSGTSAVAVPCTKTQDTSGNFACQATGTFTVTPAAPSQSVYSGDSNCPSTYSYAYISMLDFTFGASGWVQLTTDQSQTLTVTFKQRQWTQRD